MLWTVQTRSALFATGYADFADGAGGHLQAMIDGLGRNIRGSLGADREDHVAGIAGRAVLIDGAAPDGSPRQVHGRFYAWGLRLYQLTVISKPDAVPDLDLETFFRSFAPY